MEEIKTIVYFDLEATGLKSSGKPRISELSFVAVNFQDILDFHLKIEECKEKARQMNSDKIRKICTQSYKQADTLCLPNGYHSSTGVKYYRIGQLQPQ